MLYREPTSFQCFEIEHEYIPNAAFGEQTRIVDLTEVPKPPALVDAETWVLDSARVAVLSYRDDQSFDHADVYEGVDAQPWVDSIDAAWNVGEDVLQWWDRHPEYHRENWPATSA